MSYSSSEVAGFVGALPQGGLGGASAERVQEWCEFVLSAHDAPSQTRSLLVPRCRACSGRPHG
eukprot:6992358-Pyramimonas_sp.AAC.1